MAGCCSKIGQILKKIIQAIKPILQVVLLAAAVYFTWFVAPGSITALNGFTWLPTFFTTMTAANTTWAYAALGMALIIDPENIVEAVGSAAGAVGEAAGAVIAGVSSGLSNGLFGGNLLPILLGAAAIWFLFIRKDDKGGTLLSIPSFAVDSQKVGDKQTPAKDKTSTLTNDPRLALPGDDQLQEKYNGV